MSGHWSDAPPDRVVTMPRSERREFTRHEDAEILRMRSEGMSLGRIAVTTGRDGATVITNRLKILARDGKVYRRDWHVRPGLMAGTFEVELTKGAIATIDETDLPIVEPYFWSLRIDHHREYAIRNIPRPGGGQITMAMHRLIMGTQDGDQIVDHWDGNGLNNTRANLRITQQSPNMGNSRRRKDNTTGFKGVSAHGNRWRLCVAGRYHGIFDTAEQAARAYDQKAREIWGEFAQVNFP